MRGRLQARDGVLLGSDILHDDIVHVVLFDLRGQVYVDLNSVLGVLFLDGVQERVKPFCGAEVTDDPSEVDLAEA